MENITALTQGERGLTRVEPQLHKTAPGQSRNLSVSPGKCCPWCKKPISSLLTLFGVEFCSPSHKRLDAADMQRRMLERLSAARLRLSRAAQ